MLESSLPAHSRAGHPEFPSLTAQQVRQRLLERSEIALIDVREEDSYAQEHPLWATNFPLSRLELQAWSRIPRRDTLIAVYGHDESGDLAPRAAAVLVHLGYTRVHLLEGGLQGWRDARAELFRDVNVPSKAFGEYVEAVRHTPSLPAQEVRRLLEERADVVVLDARRFDEYHTMNIPGSTSVPGAELVLRARELAPNPATRIIVNCAGRTRSIIGTQSLINAGLPNPIAALRNGTIGWTLAGQALEHGATRCFGDVSAETLAQARADARRVADAAGVQRIHVDALARLDDSGTPQGRTTYWLDVRTPQEYEHGHLPGFLSAPGGQLVQETDHSVAVRGARIVLADDLLVRADMTASWLAQMGWEVYVIDGLAAHHLSERGPQPRLEPPAPEATTIDAPALHALLRTGAGVRLLDFSTGAQYVKGHVPGAEFALRAQLPQILAATGADAAVQWIFTCEGGKLARFAAADARRMGVQVQVLQGGNQAWSAAGYPLELGAKRLASPLIDRYRRPYEGTDAPQQAMQAYLEWEFGLVEQLRRDGTHHFRVI